MTPPAERPSLQLLVVVDTSSAMRRDAGGSAAWTELVGELLHTALTRDLTLTVAVAADTARLVAVDMVPTVDSRAAARALQPVLAELDAWTGSSAEAAAHDLMRMWERQRKAPAVYLTGDSATDARDRFRLPAPQITPAATDPPAPPERPESPAKAPRAITVVAGSWVDVELPDFAGGTGDWQVTGLEGVELLTDDQLSGSVRLTTSPTSRGFGTLGYRRGGSETTVLVPLRVTPRSE